MKLRSYERYGDDDELVEVIFENSSGYKISFYNTNKNWEFESETITFEEFEQAKKMFETILKVVKDLEEKVNGTK